MRRIARLKFASLFLVAFVCAGLSGQAFAVKRARMEHHRRHFRWLRLEPHVPAFA